MFDLGHAIAELHATGRKISNGAADEVNFNLSRRRGLIVCGEFDMRFIEHRKRWRTRKELCVRAEFYF